MASFIDQPILPAESFARRLPDSVDAATRMRVDALVFSADVLDYNWGVLRSAATALGHAPPENSMVARTAMLVAAWSIVDHINTARQLFQSFYAEPGEVGPKTAAFQQVAETARKMRNRMDHLNQNIPNIAATNGSLSPLLGTLSYVLAPDPSSGHAHSIMLQTGQMHGQLSAPLVNPAGQEFFPPADLFNLHAFGMDVVLGEAIAAFADLLRANVIEWEAQVVAQIKEAAIKLDVSEDSLMSHRGGGLFIALAMNFKGPPEG